MSAYIVIGVEYDKFFAQFGYVDPESVFAHNSEFCVHGYDHQHDESGDAVIGVKLDPVIPIDSLVDRKNMMEAYFKELGYFGEVSVFLIQGGR